MRDILKCRMYCIHFIMFILRPTFIAGVWFDGIKIHFNQIVCLSEHVNICYIALLQDCQTLVCKVSVEKWPN
jgi:hypothetical protein